MNLNISEIENKMVYKNQIRPHLGQQMQTSQSQIPKQQPKKNKVTYDDILSSLHMKVVDGKLQFLRTDTDALSSIENRVSVSESKIQKRTVSFGQQQNSQNQQVKMAPKTLKNRHLPIPQEYFEEEQNSIPLTKQEVIIKLLQQRQEIARINQIKSQKLLFSTNNINIAPTFAPTMSNMFFKLK